MENVLPTIFVTAHEDARVRRLAMKGREGRSVKPFLGETLIDAVTPSIAR